MNAWRRAYTITLAVITGGRPTLKLVPQGQIPEQSIKVWQDALWALLRKEQVFEQKLPDAYGWAWIGDGGWFKVGYGIWGPDTGDLADVQVTAPHPAKIYPDCDCTDYTLVHCHHISYRDSLDLSTITARYPEQGWRVEPDTTVSLGWGKQTPDWVTKGTDTISPAGGWRATSTYRRGKAEVVECWIDDPSIETHQVDEIVNMAALVQGWLGKMNGAGMDYKARLLEAAKGQGRGYPGLLPELTGRFGAPPDTTPEIRPVKKWRRTYPFGRLITCSHTVVLRDIANPYGKAFGWAQRWPFVYIPGAPQPNVVWRPGILSDHEDLQWSINKSLSLLLESEIKCTNPMIVADESAMEDEDWDLLSLVPGVKVRKRQGTDFNVVFPQPLPQHAFAFPDYMIRKLEESVGLHDPPIAPGQAVAAKTVAFMQQKGSFLLGEVAKLGDESIERLGARIVGLMRNRYVPGRPIPYFEGEKIGPGEMAPLPELPESVQLRVEATSAFQEQMAAVQAMAAAGEQAKQQGRKGRS